MTQKQMRLGELGQQMMIAEMFPKVDMSGEADGPGGAACGARAAEAKGVRALQHIKERRS